MIYKNIFEIKGTADQIDLIIQALDAIKFPWDRIKPPKGVFIIGWAELNGHLVAGKLHQGDHPAKDTDLDPFEGEINGRKYTLGVFYPATGNIYIDNMLIFHPETAKQTVSDELAHLVDFFLPLTDAMKREIYLLMHGGSDFQHGHTDWWEKVDYGAEYYDLVGESFMQAFTLAYSDMPFEAAEFTHRITKAQAPDIRRILGIQRTDYVPPVTAFKVFPPSLIYHRLSHMAKKAGMQITETTGFKPCKTCKP